MRRPPARNAVVHSVCPHDCADACSILSHVADGRLVKVEGNPEHPVTRGYLCRKFSRAPTRVYGADRLLHPLKRTGPKGAGDFRRITWDEAVATITARWQDIIAEHGPGAILPFFGSGTEGLVQGHISGRRFFNRLGTLRLERTICTKAGRIGYRYTMGTSLGADPCALAATRLVVAWGINTASTNIHHHSSLAEARRNGALYAVINPVRVPGAETADHLLQPRPGSDAALALGLMHVIIEEGLYDEDFVAGSTVGFEALRERARDFPPEKVAALTGIAAAEVREFARLYASRTSSFIYIGPGCHRHSNGGMTVRTIACLPALVGAWKHLGGGAYFPTSTVFPVDWRPLEGDEMRPNPPAGYNMITLGKLLTGTEPQIRSLYVFNGNPAAVLYNQNRVRRGLAREDLFTVVHELYMTDTARYADVVLPATTQFEHADLLFSYYHLSLLLNQQAIEPLGECRSNLETFNLLAAAMGFEEPCFAGDAWDVIGETLALDHPALKGIDLDRLLADGFAPIRPDSPGVPFGDGRFPTPSGKIELYSRTMAADGFDPLPAYIPLKEGPEGSPELFERYPLYFLTPSGHSFLNSNYGNDVGFLASERRPTVAINPADAGPRGIGEGDLVKVMNDRGSCMLWARVTTDVRRGVAVAPGQWWSRHYPDGGNANHTTPDFPADMGGGSAFNTNLVEVAPAEHPAGVGERGRGGEADAS